LARVLNQIRAWPIWLLFAIAASLTVTAAVPPFRGGVPLTNPSLLLITAISWIFFIARVIEPLAWAAVTYVQHWQDARYYLVTAIPYQCWWSVSEHPDGTNVTQFSLHCIVRNRSKEPLYLMQARVLRPRVRCEPPWVPVLLQGDNARSPYRSAGVSGAYIAPAGTAKVACTFLSRGRVKAGNRSLRAVFQSKMRKARERRSEPTWSGGVRKVRQSLFDKPPQGPRVEAGVRPDAGQDPQFPANARVHPSVIYASLPVSEGRATKKCRPE